MIGYHYIDSSCEQRGPVSSAELHRLHQEARIHDSTLVLEEGKNQWKVYSQILNSGPILLPAPPFHANALIPPLITVDLQPPIGLASTASPRVPQRNFYPAFFLCITLGIFGAHRFYLGVQNGLFQLITLGGLGIWTLVDLVRLLTNDFPDGNGGKLKNPNPRVTWSIAGVFGILVMISGNGDREKTKFSNDSRKSSVSPKAILGDTNSAERWLRNRIEATTDATVRAVFWFGTSQIPPVMAFNGEMYSPRQRRTVSFSGYVTVKNGDWELVDFKIE